MRDKVRVMRNKGAVYQSIRKFYRGQQSELSVELERQVQLSSDLYACNRRIAEIRRAIRELDEFAVAAGWTPEDWGGTATESDDSVHQCEYDDPAQCGWPGHRRA